jgi:hypothetical protein
MKKFIQIILFLGTICLNTGTTYGHSEDLIEISGQEVMIPSKLENIQLYKDDNGFHVIKNNKRYDIQNCFCDKLLRNISTKQLKKFLGRDKPQLIIFTPEELEQINYDYLIEIDEEDQKALLDNLLSSGYIAVSQMSDGEYTLQAYGRLLGGGFWNKKYFKICCAVVVGGLVVGLVCTGVGAGVGALIAAGAGKAAAAGACIGAGCGGGLGFITGAVIGGIDEKNEHSKKSTDDSNSDSTQTATEEEDEAQKKPMQIPRLRRFSTDSQNNESHEN